MRQCSSVLLQGMDAPVPECCLLYPWKDGSLSSASSTLSSELPVVSAWSGDGFGHFLCFCVSSLSALTLPLWLARLLIAHPFWISSLAPSSSCSLSLSFSHALSHHCSITDTVRESSSTSRLLPHPRSLSLSASSVWVSLSVCFWVTEGPHSGKETQRVQSN